MFKTTNYCNRLVTNTFNPLVTLTPITNYFNRPVNLRSCYPIIIELSFKIISPRQLLVGNNQLLCIY